MKIKLCKFFLGMSPCQKLRHASLKQYNSTGPTMAVLGNFCRKKYLIQISVLGTNKLKILQIKRIFVTSILKSDITIVPLCFLMFYLLVTKIEICLKYFLDKNPKKQP